ncbi:MFS transporter [Xylogone sp. PMI_703]|nr:MFS transporter [Xylogone sp. PMI_703]
MPPDGGYGWVCVACVFWNNAHQWGIAASYAVFLSHFLTNSTFPNASSLDYAFIGGLSVSQALLVSPIVSIITRRFNINITIFLGVLFETAALIGSSFSNSVWQLYLSQGVCFGWGIGFQYVSTIGIIPQWFSKRRSLASGIAAAGSGVGGLIYTLSTNALISRFGVAWAYRTLAIIQFSVNTLCAILLRDRNSRVGAKLIAIDSGLLKLYQYWLFLGWSALSIMGFMVLLFSLDDYSRSIGLNAQQGSVVTAILNLGQAVGRPIVGYFSDIVGRMNMAAFATLLSSILCLVLWVFAKSYGLLIFFALFSGAVFGTFWTAVSPLGAEVVGLQDLPSCLTIMWLACSIPATFAEPIGLTLRKTGTNEYLDPQLFTGFMYLGAAIFMFLLRSWKMRAIEGVELPTAIIIVEATGNDSEVESVREKSKSAAGLLDFVSNGVKWKRV